MKAPRWIWPLSTVGAIAVANLSCFGLCGLLHLCLFPGVVVHVDQEPHWKLAIDDALGIAMIFLTFPVGWLGGCFQGTDMPGPPLLDVVFVPINAYVWGWIGEATWCHQKQNPLWIFKSTLALLGLLVAMILIAAPFWLLRVLHRPGEWDFLALWAGLAAFSLLILAARRMIRSKRLTIQEGQRQPPSSGGVRRATHD